MQPSNLRGTLVAALLGLVALGAAGSAQAAPSLTLVWTGTTGTGTTGGPVIEAVPGDTLTLSVLLDVDALGVVAWSFSLFGSGVTALSGTECPAGSVAGSYSNFADGKCFTGTTVKTPIQTGVSASGADLLGYDGGSLTLVPGPLPQPIYLGLGVFLVTGVPFIEAIGAVEDASFDLHDVYAATVPEPGTLGLLGLGLCALGVRRFAKGRRR